MDLTYQAKSEVWQDGLQSTPELRLILVGNIGCGKTLTVETLLDHSSPSSPIALSRLCEVRRGEAEGRRLVVVETPRWYWSGEQVEESIRRETERALSLTAPGPHAFLILVPVGQFTDMERRIPEQLERVFGEGVLGHALVLLTCGDYLMGRDEEQYLKKEEPGLMGMVEKCGGRWHVFNNRRPENRQQVASLLEKVELLAQSNGGCYLQSALQREVEARVREKEREFVRRYSFQEESVTMDHSLPSQALWTGRSSLRVRRREDKEEVVTLQQLANGLYSQAPSFQAESAAEHKQLQKGSSFKLNKEGAILSQMTEKSEDKISHNSQNFVNSIHHYISNVSEAQTTPLLVSSSSSSPTASPRGPSVSTSGTFVSSSAASVSSKGTSVSSSGASVSTSAPSVSSKGTSVSTSGTSVSCRGPSVSSKGTSVSTSAPSVSSKGTSVSTSGTSVSCRGPSVSSSGTSVSPSSASISSSGASLSSEVRLVLLGPTEAGKSSVGNTILGREEFKSHPVIRQCVRGTSVIGPRQVVVVNTLNWFWSSCSPEEMRAHQSPCMTLCAPGPHAFLLCVPVTQPAHAILQALPAVEDALGPDAVSQRTLVVFTDSDLLKGGGEREGVEGYIASKHPEMLELVERCGDRYHVLQKGKKESVKELLEKVEQAVKESGGGSYNCEMNHAAKERTTLSSRERGGEEQMDTVDRAISTTLHSLREEDEGEEALQAKEETKKGENLEKPPSSSSSPFRTALHFVGGMVAAGARRLPKPVAGGALVGGAVGLFFGGPVAGLVGATAGTVAAEVGRRKYLKPKTE